jgi:hypothetical protein
LKTIATDICGLVLGSSCTKGTEKSQVKPINADTTISCDFLDFYLHNTSMDCWKICSWGTLGGLNGGKNDYPYMIRLKILSKVTTISCLSDTLTLKSKQ